MSYTKIFFGDQVVKILTGKGFFQSPAKCLAKIL